MVANGLSDNEGFYMFKDGYMEGNYCERCAGEIAKTYPSNNASFQTGQVRVERRARARGTSIKFDTEYRIVTTPRGERWPPKRIPSNFSLFYHRAEFIEVAGAQNYHSTDRERAIQSPTPRFRPLTFYAAIMNIL